MLLVRLEASAGLATYTTGLWMAPEASLRHSLFSEMKWFWKIRSGLQRLLGTILRLQSGSLGQERLLKALLSNETSGTAPIWNQTNTRADKRALIATHCAWVTTQTLGSTDIQCFTESCECDLLRTVPQKSTSKIDTDFLRQDYSFPKVGTL